MPRRINRLHVLVVAVLLLAGRGAAVEVPLRPADLDGDGDVDSCDTGIFAECLSGAEVPPVSICAIADFYGDGDVDQADFGFLQRCLSGADVPADPACAWFGPQLAYYGNDGCHHVPFFDDDYPGCEDDRVEITIVASAIRFVHYGATYNCCPDDIRVVLVKNGSVLHLEETEFVTMPCPCLCCYEIESVVVGLSPGSYQVEYCWSEWGTGKVCETRLVDVP